MSAHPDASTQADQDDLEKLVDEVAALGYKAQLVVHPDRLPYVNVTNPHATQLAERVYAQAGTFFWPWADAIGPTDHPVAAAAAITRVLRATEKP